MRADGIVRIGHFLIAKKPPLILGEEATGIVSRMGLASKDVGVIVHRGGLAVFAMGWDMGGDGGSPSSLRRWPDGISIEEGR